MNIYTNIIFAIVTLCYLVSARDFDDFSDAPASYIKRLLGAKLMKAEDVKLPSVSHDLGLINSLPESFDAREKWPQCESLKEIRNQGECGSCWAFGAVEAMTDRYCIYSNGSKKFHFSAEDLMTCSSSAGCSGGYPHRAWEYWHNTGIVSGGNYNSKEGCRPYSIPEKASTELNNEDPYTPPCNRTCQDGYNVPYEDDKRFGANVYQVQRVDHIMAELYQHGPLEVGFEVYEDFWEYKHEVYEHRSGEFQGGHAVKLLGWGVENGVDYWLCANSWGPGWGKLGGFFKIRRGVNECEIESNVVMGGVPLFKN